MTPSTTSTTSTNPGPLAGLRVVDLGLSWAAPFCGMLLADLGADVIKIESSARLDLLRFSGAFTHGVRHWENSGWFIATNRGKRSVTLNLKADEGRDTLLALVRDADVLLENFAPRVMRGLGLAAEVLLEVNPRLVVISMSAYGATGPEANYTAYGDHVMHASAFASITGHPDDPDTRIATFYGDPVGGLFAALRAVASLASGEVGVQHDLSQMEALTAMMPAEVARASAGEPRQRTADKSPDMSPHGFYRCQGHDEWVAIGVRSDDEWHAMRSVLVGAGFDAPVAATLVGRKAVESELDQLVSAWTASRSPWTVTDELQAVHVPAFPVYSADHLLKDPNLAGRDFYQWIDRRPTGPTILTGPIFRFDRDGARVTGPAPRLGEHNHEVLVGELGMSPERLADLVDRGVVR